MITNTELLNKKKVLLNNLSIEKKEYTLSCLYHGVPFTFFTSNQVFFNALNNYLPNTWKNENLNHSVRIYIDPLTKFDFDFDSFSDEDSQDCYDQGEFIIQRDFAAKKFAENQYGLIIEEKICDGLFNFLRWYLPLELMKVNKLILHSSCILDKDGEAHFFLGHSGAGKTTITQLSSPRKILGDDMNLLSHHDKKVYAQAGAIGGIFKPQVNYDDQFIIKSFNWIIQSEQNKRVQLDLSRARTKLMASVSNIFWESISEQQTNYIFDSVLAALEVAPMYELHFKKDSSFWSMIESD